MIISHKYKFLFIGLPFSASSAISKELNKKYEGQARLRKHSLYHEFLETATIEEKKYFVFAVIRNPMETEITSYEKMKNNIKGNFSNVALYKHSGGHITEKQRKKFEFIQKKQASFEKFFLQFYRQPYDNLASLTIPYCDFVIRYENIQEDYITALKKAGIKDPLPLPLANKTFGKKNKITDYYTKKTQGRAVSVFGPFLEKYDYSFPVEWGEIKVSTYHKLKFKLISYLKKIKIKYFTIRKKKKSIKGSIYGNIQRNQSNK